MLKLGQYLTDNGEERVENEVDEAWLTLRDLGRLSVAQERDRKTFLLLNVSLVEEFFKEKLGPLYGDIEGPRLCRDVSSVNTEL